MLEIKEERKGLNERAGDIRTRLKESGIQTKAFDFAVRCYEMEQEARENYMDSLSLVFDTLEIGQQLDWVKAAMTEDGAGQAAAE